MKKDFNFSMKKSSHLNANRYLLKEDIMSEDYRSMWQNLGLDLVRTAVLPALSDGGDSGRKSA